MVGAANTATASGQSKLYTEAWWNYGHVTALNNNAFALSAESTVASVDLFAQYTKVNDKSTANNDMTEFTATAGKSFGPLDATLAYIYTDDKALTDNTYNMIQAYLTLNF